MPAAASSSSRRLTSRARCSGQRAWVFGRKNVRPRCRVCRPQRAVRKSASGSVHHLRGDLHPDVVPGSPRGRPAAPTGVADLRPGPLHAHPRPRVVQAQCRPRAQHERQPGRVQRPEHHAVPTLAVYGVEPDVGLGERADVRQRRSSAEVGSDQAERDQAHPGAAVEHVRLGPGGQQRRHAGRVDPPVQEGQVAPALAEQGGPGQVGRVGGDRHDGACGVGHPQRSTSRRRRAVTQPFHARRKIKAT